MGDGEMWLGRTRRNARDWLGRTALAGAFSLAEEGAYMQTLRTWMTWSRTPTPILLHVQFIPTTFIQISMFPNGRTETDGKRTPEAGAPQKGAHRVQNMQAGSPS